MFNKIRRSNEQAATAVCFHTTCTTGMLPTGTVLIICQSLGVAPRKNAFQTLRVLPNAESQTSLHFVPCLTNTYKVIINQWDEEKEGSRGTRGRKLTSRGLSNEIQRRGGPCAKAFWSKPHNCDFADCHGFKCNTCKGIYCPASERRTKTANTCSCVESRVVRFDNNGVDLV